jgi:hypothetical protein
MSYDNLPPDNRRQITDEELKKIKDSLRGLRYGAVQITVQDGVIVQIDRTEKWRIRRSEDNRQVR